MSYKTDIPSTLNLLKTTFEYGLSQEEATKRLAEHGANELIERSLKSPWRILWEQFTATMVVILIIAAVISALLGDTKDTIAILAIVIINGLLGFRQEYKAEQAMAALKKMAIPTARVRRDGHIREISSRLLVPGDIIFLEAGNRVPADCRLIESVNLRVQEAALTGESEPIEKDAQFIALGDLPLGDHRNMVYMGTVVVYGRGSAVVIATGMNTQLGKIASLIQESGEEKTPLQRRLDSLGKTLAMVAVGLVFVVFLLGLARGEDFRLMFLTSISMAVAAVPEGLPAVVTFALALGAQRMLKRKALIRKLPAVEGLGSVTVICSDKTGTLTENRMTVTVLDIAGHRIDLTEETQRIGGRELHKLLKEPDPSAIELLHQHPALVLLLAGGALCNDATLEIEEDGFQIIGDPTEGALLLAAAQMNMHKETLTQAFPRVNELPFDSERKRMTTFHSLPEKILQVHPSHTYLPDWGKWFGSFPFISFTKGAVDSLLEISSQVWVEDHTEPMTDSWRQRIITANENLAGQGVRVLSIAYRPWQYLPPEISPQEVENELIFIGLVGMIDPARPEVYHAIQTCQSAGIRPVMITGDHPMTARYIARELGIARDGSIITGQMLSEMTIEELKAVVPEVNVYARVSPEHKLKIVEALQANGQIVAMTGDGVNDAPALKKADIGVAMGITGTDVAKEASDMVLLDDNFATIVAAVEEGRTIYDNIRKFIKYTMTSNSGEIWVMLLAPFIGMPLPLLPLQILWINLVTDGLPGLALGVEPSERDVMRRPPYHPKENIFGRGMGRHILVIGLLMGLISLISGFWFWRSGHPGWQTIVFTTLTLSQMGHALAIRSQRDLLMEIGLFSNKSMLGAVLLTFILQLLVIYLPFLQGIFKTSPLLLPELAICLALSSIVFFAVEVEKLLTRRSQASQRKP